MSLRLASNLESGRRNPLCNLSRRLSQRRERLIYVRPVFSGMEHHSLFAYLSIFFPKDRGISSPLLAEAPKRAVKFTCNELYKPIFTKADGTIAWWGNS